MLSCFYSTRSLCLCFRWMSWLQLPCRLVVTRNMCLWNVERKGNIFSNIFFWLIDWCLTPTFGVVQLYGANISLNISFDCKISVNKQIYFLLKKKDVQGCYWIFPSFQKIVGCHGHKYIVHVVNVDIFCLIFVPLDNLF